MSYSVTNWDDPLSERVAGPWLGMLGGGLLRRGKGPSLLPSGIASDLSSVGSGHPEKGLNSSPSPANPPQLFPWQD